MIWRVVYMGTAEIACPPLRVLAGMPEIELAAVYTQPDRPRGRGHSVRFSPVKKLALDKGVPVLQPESLKPVSAVEELSALKPDVLVVMAYGQILPQQVLDLPPHGAVNLHASLLPRHRGASPIQQAILAGDSETGVTLMQMESGLDTGPMIAKASIPIGDDDTAASIHDQLAQLSATLIRDRLADYLTGGLPVTSQDHSAATYAGKILKSDGQIHWHQTAEVIARQIRAFTPWPGTYAHLPTTQKSLLKILRAQIAEGSGTPGQVLPNQSGQFEVATGQGSLIFTSIQREGGRPMSGADFLNGYSLPFGAILK